METLLADIRTGLVSLVAMIDAHASSPPPAPAPEPPADFITVPVTYQLFGPVQNNGSLSQVPGSEFSFQGQALTASTKMLLLGANVADVHWARAVAVWAPGSVQNEIEIVKFDDGPVNIERMGIIVGENLSTPRVGGVLLTQAFQDMVAAARANNTSHKQIGFRMKGPASYNLWEVRIEVAWKLPR